MIDITDDPALATAVGNVLNVCPELRLNDLLDGVREAGSAWEKAYKTQADSIGHVEMMLDTTYRSMLGLDVDSKGV